MPQVQAKVYPGTGESWVNSPLTRPAIAAPLGGSVGRLQDRLERELAITPAIADEFAPDRFDTMVSKLSRLAGPVFLLAGYAAVAWAIA